MDFTGCAYRAADGCKCAIGCLIPNDKYDPLMEGKSLTRLLGEGVYPFLNEIFDSEKAITLGRQLQSVHDLTAIEDWTKRLAELELSLEVA